MGLRDISGPSYPIGYSRRTGERFKEVYLMNLEEEICLVYREFDCFSIMFKSRVQHFSKSSVTITWMLRFETHEEQFNEVYEMEDEYESEYFIELFQLISEEYAPKN